MSPERLDEESKNLNVDYEGLLGVFNDAEREVDSSRGGMIVNKLPY